MRSFGTRASTLDSGEFCSLSMVNNRALTFDLDQWLDHWAGTNSVDAIGRAFLSIHTSLELL